MNVLHQPVFQLHSCSFLKSNKWLLTRQDHVTHPTPIQTLPKLVVVDTTMITLPCCLSHAVPNPSPTSTVRKRLKTLKCSIGQPTPPPSFPMSKKRSMAQQSLALHCAKLRWNRSVRNRFRAQIWGKGPVTQASITRSTTKMVPMHALDWLNELGPIVPTECVFYGLWPLSFSFSLQCDFALKTARGLFTGPTLKTIIGLRPAVLCNTQTPRFTAQ